MQAEPPILRLRGVWILALGAATLYWLIHVVAPVAEFWIARTADDLQAARPISYFERRDPATCVGYGAEKEDCIRDAIQSRDDWIATRRAFQRVAWDLDRLVWSGVINLAICLAPLLLVWVNARRVPAATESELY